MKPYYEDDLVTLYHGDLGALSAVVQASDALVSRMASGHNFWAQASSTNFCTGDPNIVLRAVLRCAKADDQVSMLGLQSKVRAQSCRHVGGHTVCHRPVVHRLPVATGHAVRGCRMTAHLKHEGPDTFVICKPCGIERHENNPKRAQRLMTEHNHTKHKEK